MVELRSREPLENALSLETLSLLSLILSPISAPSLLLRSVLPEEVETEFFLSLIELIERDVLSEPIRLLRVSTCGSVVLRVRESLVPILLPMRENLPELILLLELSPCGRVTLVLESLVPTLLPMREDIPELIRLLELSPCGRVIRAVDSLVLILLSTREDIPELIRLLELSLCGRVIRGLDSLVLILLPIREDILELMRLFELSDRGRVILVLGVLVLIELPIREDLLEIIRLLELPDCGCVMRVLLGVLVLIELPIREELFEFIRLLKLPVCGCVIRLVLGVLVLIELPIRDDLLEVIWLLEFVDVGILLLRELLTGLRVLDVTPDLMVTGCLTVVPLDRLLVILLLGRRMLYPLVVLLELELRTELLLEEILLRLEEEDLGVIVLVGVLTDRDEVIVREEVDLLGVDCLLLDADEDLEVCLLPELLLELLLLLDSLAKIGSIISIRAKINVPTTILTFFLFFSVAIILLLKYLM